MFGKKEFSQVFRVGEIVASGAGSERKNAADLRVLAIEEEFVRYQSIKSQSKNRMKYSYLKLLLDGYEDLKPHSIRDSVNAVLKRAGFNQNYSTENYAYSFAKAFHERTTTSFFLSQGETVIPPAAVAENNYIEGRRIAVEVERIERDNRARDRCIEHFGWKCVACHFDFEGRYGLIGREYIHVHHHRLKLSSTDGEHTVDPVQDLIPLCPNCHAMVHKPKEMLSIAELKQLIIEASNKHSS